MQRAREDDDNLGIVILEAVMLNHARDYAPLNQQPEKLEPDVRHDLDVDRAVIVDSHAIDRGDIGTAPQGAQLVGCVDLGDNVGKAAVLLNGYVK
jgi:hypothetical protein